jgi:hypothetical protein
MTIHYEMNQQLDQIARTSAPSPHEMTLNLPNGTLQCMIAAADAIGCAVDRIRLSLADHTRWELPRMRSMADQLCKQLRYLVEPLQVIEVDTDQPLVQARSQPPSRDAQRISSYYELLVAPQVITMLRFSAPRGESRQAVAMYLTREVLSRLLQDMADAAV